MYLRMPFDPAGSQPLKVVILIFLVLYGRPLLACNNLNGGGKIVIGAFSNSSLDNWQPVEFHQRTDYQITHLNGANVLRAYSHHAASGLIYRQRIDLHKTPLLHWRWRVEKPLFNESEQTRRGDDFAARLYVVVDGGLFFWKTRALNYVWTSHVPTGHLWKNPYAGKAGMMLAVRSNTDTNNRWVAETRNVYEDLKRAFGHQIRYIDAIAVMTDTDNTSGTALTYYGDICFSSH